MRARYDPQKHNRSGYSAEASQFFKDKIATFAFQQNVVKISQI
jgi:hypothetical protein